MTTAIRLTNVMPTSPSDYEIDKIPGAWVITCWLQPEIVLRMKFVYLERDEEVDIHCEIRLRDRNEFTSVGQFVSLMCELRHPDSVEHGLLSHRYAAIPLNLRCYFAEIGKRWAMCGDLLEFGTTEKARYAEEPVSSRDTFEGESGPPG